MEGGREGGEEDTNLWISERQQAKQLLQVILQRRARQQESGAIGETLTQSEGEARVGVFQTVGFIDDEDGPVQVSQVVGVAGDAHLGGGDEDLEFGLLNQSMEIRGEREKISEFVGFVPLPYFPSLSFSLPPLPPLHTLTFDPLLPFFPPSFPSSNHHS